jgi:saccharopine dehydrogenase-like NADP-dependent oxidoreductase
MFTVAVFGSGKIGECICALLTGSGRYKVRMCDVDQARAEQVAKMCPGSEGKLLTLDDAAGTAKLLDGAQAVISALPYYCNQQVAALAVQKGVHYFDLTEDVQTTRKVIELAKNAPVALMPQCGLAPGFISIAAFHLASQFDQVVHAKLRVGALPMYPSNKLKYNLTWSTEGLINEYGNLCEAIIDGKKQMILPLEGYETFSLDGNDYEAFNTSGGLGTLCETLAGKVRHLDYKTIRYVGHRDLMQFLMFELGFNEDRDTLRKVFERSIPFTPQDKIVIRAEVQGLIGKRLVQKTYASVVYNAKVGKHHFGGIQITTAAGVCAPLDLILTEKIGKRKGMVRCEEISLPILLENEFGSYFKDEKALSANPH